MKFLPALALGTSLLFQAASGSAADFEKIFNGKDLSGWDGSTEFWSVKDGAITGQSTAEHPVKENTFLIWTNGTLGDFELRCSYKVVPNNPGGFANSGIQYRSKVVKPSYWVVGGYQADLEAGPTYSGILYEEKGRGILAKRGEKVTISPEGKINVTGSVGDTRTIQDSIKKEGWNEYVIIAKGNHLIHKINGHTTVDVTDEQETKAAKSGILALQIHQGNPMTVQFKDIEIKHLK